MAEVRRLMEERRSQWLEHTCLVHSGVFKGVYIHGWVCTYSTWVGVYVLRRWVCVCMYYIDGWACRY